MNVRKKIIYFLQILLYQSLILGENLHNYHSINKSTTNNIIMIVYDNGTT